MSVNVCHDERVGVSTPWQDSQRDTNVSFQCGVTKVADEEKRDAYSRHKNRSVGIFFNRLSLALADSTS